MKQWKKLAALALAGIMVLAMTACAQTKETETKAPETTEKAEPVAPTGEGTSVNETLLTNVDPETYKEYIGTWYADGSSASYRIIVKDDGIWELHNGNAEIVASGTLRMNEEEELLEMYDPDGSLALSMQIVANGEVQVDVMMESLFDSMSTTSFLNVITNDISDAHPTDIEDAGSNDVSMEEETPVLPPVDDAEIAG